MPQSESIRIEIKLDNDVENYEISFLDMVKERTDNKFVHVISGTVEDNSTHIQIMENKFGPAAIVHGKRIRVYDYESRGVGYDVCDSFIDDTVQQEDNIIAPDMMTEYGGFFINEKDLKINDENFVIENIEGAKNKPSFQKAKMSKSQQLVSKAKKVLSTKKSVTNSVSSQQDTSSHTEESVDQLPNETAQNGLLLESTLGKTTKKTKDLEMTIKKTAEKEPDTLASLNNTQKIVTEMPSDLSEDLKIMVDELIKMFVTSKADCRKLDEDKLMELDTCLNGINGAKGVRSNVLRFISYSVDIKYDSILRKISKTKGKNKKQKQEPLLSQMKTAINESMVDCLQKYEAAMLVYKEKIEKLKLIQSTATSCISECDIVSENNELDVKPVANGKPAAPTPKMKAPKRIFSWNHSCKTLYYKLLSNELESWRANSNRGSMDDHVTKFISNQLHPKWPQKWMTVSNLNKMAAPVLNEFKNCLNSGKEFELPSPNIVSKKKQTTAKSRNSAPPLESPSAATSNVAALVADPALPCPMPTAKTAAMPKRLSLDQLPVRVMETIDLREDSDSPTAVTETTPEKNLLVTAIRTGATHKDELLPEIQQLTEPPVRTSSLLKRKLTTSTADKPQCSQAKMFFQQPSQQATLYSPAPPPAHHQPHQQHQNQQQHHQHKYQPSPPCPYPPKMPLFASNQNYQQHLQQARNQTTAQYSPSNPPPHSPHYIGLLPERQTPRARLSQQLKHLQQHQQPVVHRQNPSLVSMLPTNSAIRQAALFDNGLPKTGLTYNTQPIRQALTVPQYQQQRLKTEDTTLIYTKNPSTMLRDFARIQNPHQSHFPNGP